MLKFQILNPSRVYLIIVGKHLKHAYCTKILNCKDEVCFSLRWKPIKPQQNPLTIVRSIPSKKSLMKTKC